MTDTMTQPTLARWSQLIRTRAEKHITRFRTDQPLAEALTNVVKAGLGIDTDLAQALQQSTVEGWLRGEVAPESEQIHEVLLRTLGLANTTNIPYRSFKPTPQQVVNHSQLDQKLAAAMAELESFNNEPTPVQPETQPVSTSLGNQLRELYATIPEADKRALAVKTAPRSHVRTTPKTGSTEKISGLHDNRYLPERTIIDPAQYATLRIQDCTERMSQTSNVHEFLTLYRLHNAHDIISLAQRMQIAPERIAEAESGKTLPDAALLAHYKRIMKPNEYTELEDVLIANRLAIAEGLRKERDSTGFDDYETYNQRIDDVIEELPPRYWKAVLEKHNNPRKFRSKSDHSWIDEITKIEYREDYLRAARCYLGLSRDAAGQAIGKDGDFVYRLEDSMENGAGTNAKKLATLYRKQMAAESGLFDLGKYDKLATAYDPEIAREAKADAKAAQRESRELLARATQTDTSRSR